MAPAKRNSDIISEMSIVDVITQLIFDTDFEFDDSQQLILAALRQIDQGLYGVHRRNLSEYLRAMPVDEMIKLVTQIKQQLDRQQRFIATEQADLLYPLHQ